MFAARSLRVGVRGVVVFVRWMDESFVAGFEFLDGPAEVAKACGNHTYAFFQSVEGDAAETGSEGCV